MNKQTSIKQTYILPLKIQNDDYSSCFESSQEMNIPTTPVSNKTPIQIIPDSPPSPKVKSLVKLVYDPFKKENKQTLKPKRKYVRKAAPKQLKNKKPRAPKRNPPPPPTNDIRELLKCRTYYNPASPSFYPLGPPSPCGKIDSPVTRAGKIDSPFNKHPKQLKLDNMLWGMCELLCVREETMPKKSLNYQRKLVKAMKKRHNTRKRYSCDNLFPDL